MAAKRARQNSNRMPLKVKLSRYGILPYVLAAISTILANFAFPKNDLAVFISFIILVPVFAYLNFDGKIPIGYSIMLLLIAAIILPFSKTDTTANQLTISAYWLIVVGVLCLTIDYLRNRPK